MSDTATSPGYYKFPGDIEAKQIVGHLTGLGAQAVQYGIRSCRLDGNNKGKTVDERIEDLRKGIKFYEFEIARLQGDADPCAESAVAEAEVVFTVKNVDQARDDASADEVDWYATGKPPRGWTPNGPKATGRIFSGTAISDRKFTLPFGEAELADVCEGARLANLDIDGFIAYAAMNTAVGLIESRAGGHTNA